MDNLCDTPQKATSYDDFSGREWVFKAIDTWLQGEKNQIFFIFGEPGSGKTSIAYQLKKISEGKDTLPKGFQHLKNNFLVSTYFLSSQFKISLTVKSFVKSIMIQLGRAIPDFINISQKSALFSYHIDVKNHIISNHGSFIGAFFNLNQYTQEAVLDYFFDFVIAPLQEISKEKEENRIILIDGLNECLYSRECFGIADLLFSSFVLPKNIRFIITSHNDKKMDSKIRYGSNSYSAVFLSETEDYRNCRNDMNTFLTHFSKNNAIVIDENTSRLLLDKISGNFLYAKHLLDLLLTCGRKITSELLDTFPDNLDGFYTIYLLNLCEPKQDRWKYRLRPILNLLTVVYEPVSIAQISKWTTLSEVTVRDTLPIMDHLLTAFGSKSSEETRYSLYHNSFRQFLLNEKKAGDFFCDSRLAVNRIVGSYLRVSSKVISALDPYGFKYLVRHLEDLDKEDEIVSLLDKTYFDSKKNQASDTFGIISDIHKGLRIAKKRNDFVLFLKYCTFYDYYINNFPLVPADFILTAREDRYNEALEQVEFLFDINEILLVYAECYLQCTKKQDAHKSRYFTYIMDHIKHGSFEIANEIVRKISLQDPLDAIKIAGQYFDKRIPSEIDEPLFFLYGFCALYKIFKQLSGEDPAYAIELAFQLKENSTILCALTAIISVLFSKDPETAIVLLQKARNLTEDKDFLLSRFRLFLSQTWERSYVHYSRESLYLLFDILPFIPLDLLLTEPFDKIVSKQTDLAMDLSQNHPNKVWKEYFAWRLKVICNKDFVFTSTGDLLFDSILSCYSDSSSSDSSFELGLSPLTDETYVIFCMQLSMPSGLYQSSTTNTAIAHLVTYLSPRTANPILFIGACFLLRLLKIMNKENKNALLNWLFHYWDMEIKIPDNKFLNPGVYHSMEKEFFKSAIDKNVCSCRIDSLDEFESFLDEITDVRIKYSLGLFHLHALSQETILALSNKIIEQEYLIRELKLSELHDEYEVKAVIDFFIKTGYFLLPDYTNHAKAMFRFPVFILSHKSKENRLSYLLSIIGQKYIFKQLFNISPAMCWELFLNGDYHSSVILEAIESFLHNSMTSHTIEEKNKPLKIAHADEFYEVLIDLIDCTNNNNYLEGKFDSKKYLLSFEATKVTKILSKLLFVDFNMFTSILSDARAFHLRFDDFNLQDLNLYIFGSAQPDFLLKMCLSKIKTVLLKYDPYYMQKSIFLQPVIKNALCSAPVSFNRLFSEFILPTYKDFQIVRNFFFFLERTPPVVPWPQKEIDKLFSICLGHFSELNGIEMFCLVYQLLCQRFPRKIQKNILDKLSTASNANDQIQILDYLKESMGDKYYIFIEKLLEDLVSRQNPDSAIDCLVRLDNKPYSQTKELLEMIRQFALEKNRPHILELVSTIQASQWDLDQLETTLRSSPNTISTTKIIEDLKNNIPKIAEFDSFPLISKLWDSPFFTYSEKSNLAKKAIIQKFQSHPTINSVEISSLPDIYCQAFAIQTIMEYCSEEERHKYATLFVQIFNEIEPHPEWLDLIFHRLSIVPQEDETTKISIIQRVVIRIFQAVQPIEIYDNLILLFEGFPVLTKSDIGQTTDIIMKEIADYNFGSNTDWYAKLIITLTFLHFLHEQRDMGIIQVLPKCTFFYNSSYQIINVSETNISCDLVEMYRKLHEVYNADYSNECLQTVIETFEGDRAVQLADSLTIALVSLINKSESGNRIAEIQSVSKADRDLLTFLLRYNSKEYLPIAFTHLFYAFREVDANQAVSFIFKAIEIIKTLKSNAHLMDYYVKAWYAYAFVAGPSACFESVDYFITNRIPLDYLRKDQKMFACNFTFLVTNILEIYLYHSQDKQLFIREFYEMMKSLCRP